MTGSGATPMGAGPKVDGQCRHPGPRWASRVLQAALTGSRPADLRLTWHADQQARQALEADVHAFYCVLALTIAHLKRQAAQAGLGLSVRELLHTLAGIQETVMIYPSAGGLPKARRMLTDRGPAQQRLFEIFNLTALAPRA